MIKKTLLLEKFNLNSTLNELDYYFENLIRIEKENRIDYVNKKNEVIFSHYDSGMYNAYCKNKKIQEYILNLKVDYSYIRNINCFNSYELNNIEYDIKTTISISKLIRLWFFKRKNIEIGIFEFL